MAFVLDRSKITQKQNVNLTSSENLSHGFIVLYLYSCIFFVHNEVFALWLFTYCINSNLFVNVIVSASIVEKYEYNGCPPSQFVIGYGTFIINNNRN